MSADKAGPILIVTALEEELEAILSRATEFREGAEGSHAARIGGFDVAAAATGDGVKNAQERAAFLCDAIRPSALFGAGLAGALSADLAIGELVVSSSVRDAGGEAPAPDADLLRRAAEAGAAPGVLVTVERPAVSRSEKAALAATLAPGARAAVDMESAAWARAAAHRGIPYAIVRAVSDRADEELPEYLSRCVGEDGGIRRGAVALYSLVRPGTIPALMRMKRRMELCGERLATFFERFLAR